MKLRYRPEIDGLRAIAVCAVILYHAQIMIFGTQPFKGGFIGVDIFFVLSGYLITSIILKELITTGTFSFKKFYERRSRRILPALLFVMLISLPFAWIYLLPSSFVNFSETILYSLGFSSNFYFHYTFQQYGAESGLLKPFLHTWSLSVEEQYYILIPIILLITFKYFKNYLIYILFLGFIISLVLADWGSRNYPSFNFYILTARGWELLAGSILAFFEISLGHRSKNQTLNSILPSTGILLIGHSIIFFNDKMFHPSYYTLSPIIGVCLIIWFSNKNEIITRILSSKLFVGIGLISYSLYLWHYPIFAFARITEFTQGNIFLEIFLGIIILLASISSYYLVEKPARNKKFKFKFILSSVIILTFVLVVFNLNVISNEGYKNRLPNIIKILKKKPWNLLKSLDGKTCYHNYEACKFNTSSTKKVYIVGDSHMATLTLDLHDKVIEQDYQFITSTIGGCLYYPGFDKVDVKLNKISEKCNNDYFTKLKETLSKEKNSIIIFGGMLPLHITDRVFNNQEGGREGKKVDKRFISLGKYQSIQSSFKNEVLELSKKNNILLIYPIPEVGWDVPNKLKNLIKSFPKDDKDKVIETSNFITTSYQVYQNRTRSSFNLLDSIQGKNIYRVFPHKLFCDTIINERCITHNDKQIFYADYNHPSLKGAEMINELIMIEINKMR